MFKFSYGVITAATIAAAIGPAFAQQPSKPPAAPAASDTGQSPAPAGAHAYIINLKNGDTVTSPFKVQFGLTPNMGIAPAGVDKENVGHHHLLIDTTLKAEEMAQPMVMDEQHVHFGKGQTETTVTLPPGKHTLQLVLANWTHIPFNPPVQSEVITITVKGAAKPVAAAETKAAPKEAAKDVAKEAPKVAQDVKKETPKETSKETSKEAPKEASSKNAKKDAPKDAAKKEVKTEASKDAKKDDDAKEAKVTPHHRRHHRHHRHHYREQYLHT